MGTKILGFSIGRGLGALEGLRRRRQETAPTTTTTRRRDSTLGPSRTSPIAVPHQQAEETGSQACIYYPPYPNERIVHENKAVRDSRRSSSINVILAAHSRLQAGRKSPTKWSNPVETP